MSDHEVKQRPMSEIRRLVAEDNARFEQVAEAWHDLTVDQQGQLVIIAQSMAAREAK
jgi:hypothetical protein